MLRLTTDGHKASRGFSATAELLCNSRVINACCPPNYLHRLFGFFTERSTVTFCRATLCRCAVSIHPSVCPSVTFVHCIEMSKQILKLFSPCGSSTILVFPYQTLWEYSDAYSPDEGVECRWDMKNSDYRPISRLISETIDDRVIFIVERQRELVYGLYFKDMILLMNILIVTCRCAVNQ